jgi:hypothetical protein
MTSFSRMKKLRIPARSAITPLRAGMASRASGTRCRSDEPSSVPTA